MRDAGWHGMTPEIIEGLEAERLPPDDLDAQARQIQAIVHDFQPDQALNAIYRLPSGFSHASTALVDSYIQNDPTAPAGISLRREPEHAGVGSCEAPRVLCRLLVSHGARRHAEKIDPEVAARRHGRGFTRLVE